MYRWRPVVVGILTFILTPLLPAGPTSAHAGDGGGAIDAASILEAEQYDSAESDCDPDRDGEHIHAADVGGERAVFFGLSGCHIVFNNVYFSSGARPSHFRVQQYAAAVQVEMQVYIDNTKVGSGRFWHKGSGSASWEGFPFTTTDHFAGGWHSVRIEYRITSGSDWYNLWLDHIAFAMDCLNASPSVDPSADGLAGALMGWGGYEYGFTADAADPDGDPLAITWDWDDGVSRSGQTTVRSFDLAPTEPVARQFTLRVREDVSARCPQVGFLDSSFGPYTFTVVPDLQVAHPEVEAGTSCNGGLFLPSWLTDDVLVGMCSMGLSVDLRGADPSILGDTMVLLDGVEVPPTRTIPFELDLDSSALGNGTHTLSVCARGDSDKHGRLLCGTDYTFRSIPCANSSARFDGVVTDGLSGAAAGWKDLSYSFSAVGLHDPDEDPLATRWEWADGMVSHGATVARPFPLGENPYQLVVEEDLSARCPDAGIVPAVYGAGGLATAEPLVFHGVADWEPVLLNPVRGTSCLYTVRIPNFLTQGDSMTGTCRVRARIASDTPGVVPVGTLLFDGTETLATREGAEFWAWYESLEHSTGRHWIETCFEATFDKYERRFCTTSHAFWNVGRP